MKEFAGIIKQLEQQKSAIERAIGALREVSDAPAKTAGEPKEKAAPKKRRMSAEGRKRIGDAARRRWAALKAEKEAGEGAPAVKRRGRKSAGSVASE